MSRFAALLTAVVITVTLSGCFGVVVAPHSAGMRHAGPPPHAPAHGHRHKHQSGVVLRFDSGLGVYAVVDRVGVYFHDGWFVRFHDGGWQVCASLDGRWRPRSAEWVPPGLRSKHHAKKPKHRGRGPAKRAH